MTELPKINVVTIGHVDHGKSTLIGRLLYDSGNAQAERIEEIKEVMKKLHKKKFEYAYLLDTFQEEREGNMTIDIVLTPFNSAKYAYTFIDCPGHKELIKNMITGTSYADAAIFVVSAKEGEGIQEQTREHAWLAKTMGIEQLVVIINKMDTVDYAQEKFDKLATEVRNFLESIDFDVSKMLFIPVSAIEGDNVYKHSDRTSWYDGRTLIEALDASVKPVALPIHKPLRMIVQDSYDFGGKKMVVGRIETGAIRKGEEVVFMPSGVRTKVESIDRLGSARESAQAGESVGLLVCGDVEVKRGEVCADLNDPINTSKEFQGQIFILNAESPIKVGYECRIRCGTATENCRVEKIVRRVDPRSGDTIEENPGELNIDDAAVVIISVENPIVVEKHLEFPHLGRFVLREAGVTKAVGIVLEIAHVE